MSSEYMKTDAGGSRNPFISNRKRTKQENPKEKPSILLLQTLLTNQEKNIQNKI